MDTTQVVQDTSPFLGMVAQSIQAWLESKNERNERSIRAVEYYSEVHATI